MKLFKTLTLATAILASGAMFTVPAIAATYSTTIAISDLSQALDWTESTVMQFPTVVLDGATAAGHVCITYNSASSNNTLCPGNRDSTANGIFSLTGTPNGAVAVQLDTTPVVKEGIEFQAATIAGNTVTLNNGGNGIHSVGGVLIMRDPALVTSTNITFNYDLEYTAQ